MQALRKTIIKETDGISSKPRFGLFSQPASLCIGDNSMFNHHLHSRDENGRPKTQQRNVVTRPTSSGVLKSSSYFKVPESLYVGDPYNDCTILFKRHPDFSQENGPFRPASGFKTIACTSYKKGQESKLNQSSISTIRKVKDAYGRVIIQPRNVVTNPCINVQTQFLKYPEHLPDPYDLKEKQEKLDNYRNRNKIKEPFRSMNSGPKILNKILAVYGSSSTDNSPRRPNTSCTLKRKDKNQSYDHLHDSSFRPSSSKGGFIGKYPEFMPTQIKEDTPRRKPKQQGEVFKPSSGQLSRPTPSITLMNLKSRLR